MLTVLLAIVSLVATTNAAITEYSEEALAKFKRNEGFKDPEITATLINSNLDIELRRVSGGEWRHDIVMEPVYPPASSLTKEEICESFFGIEINGKKYCGLPQFTVQVELNSRNIPEGPLKLVFYFGYKKFRPLELVVPVFRKNLLLDTPSQTDLNNVATDTHGNFISPFPTELLDSIITDAKATFNFSWLGEVLTNSISESKRETDLYFTRSFVLSEEIVEHIKVACMN